LQKIDGLSSVQSVKLLSIGAYREEGAILVGPNPKSTLCSWDTNRHDWDNFEPLFKYRLDGGQEIIVEQEAPSPESEEEDVPSWTGAIVWTGAIQLSKYVEVAMSRSEFGPPCIKMVELGAGTGLIGIVAGALGAQVSLTDLDYVLPRLQRNVDSNATAIGAGGSVAVAPLHWGETETVPFKPCDVVLACEVVYSEGTIPILIQTLRDLSGPGTIVLLAYDLRGRVGVEEFFVSAVEYFSCEEVPKEEQHPDWFCDKVVLLRMQLRPRTATGGIEAFESEHRLNTSVGLLVKHPGVPGTLANCQTVPIGQLTRLRH